MEKTETLGRRLLQVMEERGLNYDRLGKLLDMKPQTLNRYVLGQREPKARVATEMAMKLEVDPLWLQGYDVPKTQTMDPLTQPGETLLPILGTIRAGVPTLAQQEILGYMAADVPHCTLTMTDDYRVLADDVLCDSLAGRQAVLQGHCANSVCVQFDEIKNANKTKLRSVFTGKQVVYVYHNQIDARGDKANTEDEVFVACEEAIQEIMDLIRRISSSANTHRFLVTADHGFIYKRDKLTESDKISVNSKKAFVNRRFVVAGEPVSGDGVQSMSMGRILGNDDAKIVSFPVGSSVFKVAGGGANFVHGGSSPQEMLVPVIDIKMERGHMETRPAQIALVSLVQKITNLIVSMDFIQSDAVTDTVKGTTYRLYFISENGERISNENMLAADSRETDASKRMTRLRFTFKNQKYDRSRQYYLVACEESTGLEAWRHPVIMDLAFGDDFGFGF